MAHASLSSKYDTKFWYGHVFHLPYLNIKQLFWKREGAHSQQ